MKLTETMHDAAIAKAVELGLTPRTDFVADVADHWRKLGEVVAAALAAADDDLARLGDPLRSEVARLAAERDKLIDACIAETPHENDHAWSWGLRARGGFERTRADAIAAVRKAAGLED